MHLDLIDWIVMGAFALITLVIGISYTGKASGKIGRAHV